MDTYEWHYHGDVDLRHGGLFWREDGDDEQVWIVRVIPCSDAGGPDNLFHVQAGHLYLGDDASMHRAALTCCGSDPENFTREELVLAVEAYDGQAFNPDEERVVRIGTPDPFWSGRGENPEPNTVLRSNVSLRKFVTREFLHKEPVRSAGPAGP